MNDKKQRTMFIGIDLYYSQEYVDEIVKIANKYHDIIYKIEENCNEEIKKRYYAKLDAFDCARLSAFYDIYEKLQELKDSDKDE